MKHDLQGSLQAVLERLVAEGLERGLQVAVYHEGRLVADAFAGMADPTTGRPVTGETLFPVFSISKGITATLIHQLVERGKLTYETPIAELWPEFAAHGKERITLRHALTHTAGIPYMPMGITHADLADWDRMCAAIAGLTPAFPPGWELIYHAITYGWIVGETARRADGRPFQRLLKEEICDPLGIGTLFIGIPDGVDLDIAEMEVPPPYPFPDDTVPQAIPALVHPLNGWMNRADARRACLPASTGIMNARAIARHYAALLPGGVDGVELLPPERICVAVRPHQAGRPQENPDRRGLGYQIRRPFSEGCFGHDGAGGCFGVADRKYRIAVGFTRNGIGHESSRPRIEAEIQKAFGIPAGA